MSRLKILCLGLLLVLILSEDRTLLHLQTSSQKEQYFNELLVIEQALEDNSQELYELVHKVDKSARHYKGYEAVEKEVLESGLLEERKILYDMDKIAMLPLEKKTWECKNLTEDQVNNLNTQIALTQKNIATLQDNIQNEGQCQRNEEIQSQLGFLALYLDHLVTEMKNVCEFQSAQLKVVNPKGKFIFGNQTKEEYERKIQDFREIGYTTDECPESQPYPQSGDCVGCNDDEIYDLLEEKCIHCQSGKAYSSKSRSCIEIKFNNNPKAENYFGSFPSASSEYQTCPNQTPFFDGYHCITCTLPSYFDFTTTSCKACEEGLVFDAHSKTCSFVQYNSYITKDSNICCGKVEHNPNQATCPPEKPFFNGKTCIICDLPSYFSTEDAACAYCKQHNSFSIKQKKCIDDKFFAPQYSSRITPTTNQNYQGQIPTIPKQYENVVECDKDKPFSVKKGCVQCKYPHYFNFQSSLCESCRANDYFNLEKHQCMPKGSQGGYNPNLANIQNYQGTIPEFNEKLPTCPEDYPFFDGKECIKCQLPKFIDFDTDTCKSCPKGRTFSTFNRQCQYTDQSFYTNLKDKNIYFNGDFSDIEHSIRDKKTANPKVKECSISTPYYNALTNKCIKCSVAEPLYDIKYNRCMKCKDDSQFNQEKHVCISDGQVTPTLERMIMNTIGWI